MMAAISSDSLYWCTYSWPGLYMRGYRSYIRTTVVPCDLASERASYCERYPNVQIEFY